MDSWREQWNKLVCLAFDFLPSELGLAADPVTESVVSLARQRKEDEKRDRRAPGDWAVMFEAWA